MDKSRQPGASNGVSERELARSETIYKSDVSRETLARYINMLSKWQKKINLISEKTESDIWHRHIDDSLQLVKYIPDATKTIIDIGSGGGLPGIPLAIATKIKTYLIESDTRKAVFLQEAIRELAIDATVINERIETAKLQSVNEPVVITARALASMKEIFALIHSLLEKNNLRRYTIILAKGKNVSRETSEAEADWEFVAEYKQSETDEQASIVIITELKPRPNIG